MRSMLYDPKTGQVFSEEHGWNANEASLRHSGEWSTLIYQHTGPLKRGKWKDRDLLVLVPLPMEPEILT
ncbi:hypothetical protein KAR91_23195 [Candidatus Pacearchaeota archaeon]|nr:hypothetical protein [Candidatus Pacearchaeota archaeon]